LPLPSRQRIECGVHELGDLDRLELDADVSVHGTREHGSPAAEAHLGEVDRDRTEPASEPRRLSKAIEPQVGLQEGFLHDILGLVLPEQTSHNGAYAAVVPVEQDLERPPVTAACDRDELAIRLLPHSTLWLRPATEVLLESVRLGPYSGSQVPAGEGGR
jgi:hypothetical protein